MSTAHNLQHFSVSADKKKKDKSGTNKTKTKGLKKKKSDFSNIEGKWTPFYRTV